MWFLLAACSLPPPLASRDADDDGVSVKQGDCDDQDEDVNPDAVEICNGLDDDCDGVVDAGVCESWSPSGEVPSILGEDGVGTVLEAGRFDGDAVDDLLTDATLGGSPAICVIGGGRVSGVVDQSLASVSNCWITSRSQVEPVVVSADRYAQDLPVGQDVAIVGTGDQLCVVDVFAPEYTLEDAAYGCIENAALPAEVQSGYRLAAADVDRGTLAVTSSVYLGIVDPIDYLSGAPVEPAVIEFQSRIGGVENVGDLDADGVTDVVVAVGSRAYIVRGNTDLTGPVELITPYFVDATGPITAMEGLGDLDGDGVREWMSLDSSGTKVWSLNQTFSTISLAPQGASAAGDFNGDGKDDVWARSDIDGDTSVLRLYLGGAWPLQLTGYDLSTVEMDGGFASATAPAGAFEDDGFADTWVSAPTSLVDEEVRGRLYRVAGWALDSADPTGTTE